VKTPGRTKNTFPQIYLKGPSLDRKLNTSLETYTPFKMGSYTLPAMQTNPKFIFFTDFDGTITQSDSNDFLTDNLGYGQKLRKQGNQDVLMDKMSFRDSFQGMMESVKTPYDQCIKTLLENIKLDPHFKEFHDWCRQNNVPVVVLSSGMEPIIRALLVHLVGKEADDIQIVANNVAPRDGKSINEEGGWQIVFHDDR
jgi:2,3-diketo-5-methylthio-1-phosphopentane phosphatase